MFEVDDTAVHDFGTDKPSITFRHDGKDQRIDCDFIAGCDGFHGICRPSFPEGVLTFYDREYPFGWLGILGIAAAGRRTDLRLSRPRLCALHHALADAGAALSSRSTTTRTSTNWPDDRIWEELHMRLGGHPQAAGRQDPAEGRHLDAQLRLRADADPGRLFLAGRLRAYRAADRRQGHEPRARRCAHAVARARRCSTSRTQTELLEGYSTTCLQRVWKAQRFSWWMTQIFHVFPDEVPFDRRRQLAELDYLAHSHGGADLSRRAIYRACPLRLSRFPGGPHFVAENLRYPAPGRNPLWWDSKGRPAQAAAIKGPAREECA